MDKDMNERRVKSISNKGCNFLVTIYYQEHYSYQGTIQWLESGKTINFRSEMEMINLIHEATKSTSSTQYPLRTWEDQSSPKVI